MPKKFSYIPSDKNYPLVLTEKGKEKYDDNSSYKSFLNTLPKNLSTETKDYNTKRGWELHGKPPTMQDAIESGWITKQDDGYHMSTVAYNKENDTYEFLKSKEHQTIGKEFEWYNSSNANEFRKKYKLVEDQNGFKYVNNKNTKISNTVDLSNVKINYNPKYRDAKQPEYSAENFPTQKEVIANYIKNNPIEFPKYFKSLPVEQQKEAFNKVVSERKNYPAIKNLMYEASFGGAAPIAGLEYISKIPAVKKAFSYIGNKIKPSNISKANNITENIIENTDEINLEKIFAEQIEKDKINKKNYLNHKKEGEDIGIGYFGNYKKGISKLKASAIERMVLPYSYDKKEKIFNAIPNLVMGKIKPESRAVKNRLDSWRLYNGLEQKYNTFRLSPDGKSLRVNNYVVPIDNISPFINAYQSIDNGFNFGGIAGHHPTYALPSDISKKEKFLGDVLIRDIYDLNPFKNKNIEIGKYINGKPYNVEQPLKYNMYGDLKNIENLRYTKPKDELGYLEIDKYGTYYRGDNSGFHYNDVEKYINKTNDRNLKFNTYAAGLLSLPIAYKGIEKIKDVFWGEKLEDAPKIKLTNKRYGKSK